MVYRRPEEQNHWHQLAMTLAESSHDSSGREAWLATLYNNQGLDPVQAGSPRQRPSPVPAKVPGLARAAQQPGANAARPLGHGAPMSRARIAMNEAMAELAQLHCPPPEGFPRWLCVRGWGEVRSCSMIPRHPSSLPAPGFCCHRMAGSPPTGRTAGQAQAARQTLISVRGRPDWPPAHQHLPGSRGDGSGRTRLSALLLAMRRGRNLFPAGPPPRMCRHNWRWPAR